MSRFAKCCCPDSCVTACPTHSAHEYYNTNITGFNDWTIPVRIDRNVNPMLYCSFAGSGCMKSAWQQKSSVSYGNYDNGNWPSGTFTYALDNPTYCRFTSGTSFATCTAPGGTPVTQRRYFTGYLQKFEYRQVQQLTTRASISIYPITLASNMLQAALTLEVYFASIWQGRTGEAFRWKPNTVSWDGSAYTCTNGAETVDTIPSAPSWHDPYQSEMQFSGSPVLPGGCAAFDVASDDNTSQRVNKVIGEIDVMPPSGYSGPCYIYSLFDATVVEPGWRTNAAHRSLLCIADGIDRGINQYVGASYTYLSDPFNCASIDSPIPLKRSPYSNVAAVSESFNQTTFCWVFPQVRQRPAVPRDLTLHVL